MRREGQSALGFLLYESSAEERRMWLEKLNKCKEMAAELGLNLYVSPNLAVLLEGSLETKKAVSRECVTHPTSEPLTRLCTLPWTHHIVYFSGKASPCCSLSHSLGNAFEDPVPLFGGPKHERLKQTLLSGELYGPCTKCTIYPLGLLTYLQNQLGDLGVIVP
jgi:hypothetical protein